MPTSSHALGDAGKAGGTSCECEQPHTRPGQSPAACRGLPYSQPSKGRIVARIMEQVRRFDTKALPALKKQSSGPIPSKIYVSRSHEEENARRPRSAIGNDDMCLHATGLIDHYLVELQSERVGSLAINTHATEDEEQRNRIPDQELWSRESQLTLLVAHSLVENKDTSSRICVESQRMRPAVIAEGECTSTILLSKNKTPTASSFAWAENSFESSFGTSNRSQSDHFSVDDPQGHRMLSCVSGDDASSSLDTYPEEDEVHVMRPWMESTESWMESVEVQKGCKDTIDNVQSPQAQTFSPRAASILLQGTSELTMSNSSHSSSDPGLRFDCIGLLHSGFRSCALPITGECVGRRTVDTIPSED
jgi:hypothetical protein